MGKIGRRGLAGGGVSLGWGADLALLGNYGVQFIFTRLVATRFGET